jgi:YbgC/YbaW family acyl-CoA thioester hydrolase
MYPILKLTSTLFRAKYREKLTPQDKSIIKCRAGLMDIDVFLELNNARYFNYMELGRWDYIYRSGFLSMMKEKKWAATVGGASIRYRRRIPFLSRFTLTTQLICHDGRWFYILQETYMKDKICSSALMKVGAVSNKGLVSTEEIMHYLNFPDWKPAIPQWVNAWIEAEGLRPWPGNQS